jgi:hypothetical protein
MVEIVRAVLGQIKLGDSMHIELDFSANENCNDIVLEVYLDQDKIFQSVAQKAIQTIVYDLVDTPANHELKLVMSGKNCTHTILDSENKIISDVFFKINRLEFEELDMKEIFCLGRRSRHRHSFNSTQPEFDDEFYGEIGCNGTVFMPFTTPIYLWLSENLD